MPEFPDLLTFEEHRVHSQDALPQARVLYSSATGCSEIRHLAYMSRLGLWGRKTPFRDCSDFVKKMSMSGNGGSELLALEMKKEGKFVARSLRCLPLISEYNHV